MLRKRWVKTMVLFSGGTVFALGLGLNGACGAAILQRFLVSLAFD